MSTDPCFDGHAADYDATVQRAIGASGESVQFFAELKVTLMRHALASATTTRILDFGCGIGNTTRAISAQFPRASVIGVDVSTESLAVARQASRHTEQIRYVDNTGPRLPFADASFDVAFTACVFHHIEIAERPRWAQELRRVLAPGGLLFLFEHNPLNPLTVRVVKNVPFDEGVVLLRGKEALRLLSDAGFETTSPYYYFFFPAALSALRRLEPLLHRVPLGAQYFVTARRQRA